MHGPTPRSNKTEQSDLNIAALTEKQGKLASNFMLGITRRKSGTSDEVNDRSLRKLGIERVQVYTR